MSNCWQSHGCSPQGSSVHGISQARILEWVAISFSRGIFSTQESSPYLLHWQADPLAMSHLESPLCKIGIHYIIPLECGSDVQIACAIIQTPQVLSLQVRELFLVASTTRCPPCGVISTVQHHLTPLTWPLPLGHSVMAGLRPGATRR